MLECMIGGRSTLASSVFQMMRVKKQPWLHGGDGSMWILINDELGREEEMILCPSLVYLEMPFGAFDLNVLKNRWHSSDEPTKTLDCSSGGT